MGFCGGWWIKGSFALRGHGFKKKGFESYCPILPLLFLTPWIIIRVSSFLASSCVWQVTLNLTVIPKIQSLEQLVVQVLVPTVFVFSLRGFYPYS